MVLLCFTTTSLSVMNHMKFDRSVRDRSIHVTMQYFLTSFKPVSIELLTCDQDGVNHVTCDVISWTTSYTSETNLSSTCTQIRIYRVIDARTTTDDIT